MATINRGFGFLRADEFRALLNVSPADFELLRKRDPDFPKSQPLTQGTRHVWLREQAESYARQFLARWQSSEVAE